MKYNGCMISSDAVLMSGKPLPLMDKASMAACGVFGVEWDVT